MTERGRIAVDSRFETSLDDVYAIGDVIEANAGAQGRRRCGGAVEMMAAELAMSIIVWCRHRLYRPRNCYAWAK